MLYVAVTVEGLKAKLQKKEREVDSKKQELVSNKDSQDSPCKSRLFVNGPPYMFF